MNQLGHKRTSAKQRANRVRTVVRGNAERPRLSVNVSNLHISAQIIDDTAGKTLASATSVGQKLEANLTKRALWVGTEIAKKAKKAKVGKVVFDRGSRKFHGRVKTLADAAREGGLEF